MPTNERLLRKTVARALTGEGAHVATETVFTGLNWKLAGALPESAPHSLYQLIEHISFWNDWVLDWLDGKNPRTPAHASGSWRAAASPANASEWKKAVQRFRHGLRQLARRSHSVELAAGETGKKSALEMLRTVASHNSYHVGQAVTVRQMLGAWPPPSGGLTW